MSHEQEVYHFLLAFDVTAYVVHNLDQADVCLDEYILSLCIQRFAFGLDAVGGFLRAADEVDTRLVGVLCELL